MQQKDVKEQIEKGKGTQFDPDIADIMISMIDEDKDYRMHEDGCNDNDQQEKLSESMITRMDAETELPEEFKEIKQIDTGLGLFLCGDVDDYLDAVSIFAGSVRTKSEKIEEAFSCGDIETFRMLTHSLKSSARTIGAVHLSDLAKQLESAAKEGDMDMIREKTGVLLSEYRELEGSLERIRV